MVIEALPNEITNMFNMLQYLASSSDKEIDIRLKSTSQRCHVSVVVPDLFLIKYFSIWKVFIFRAGGGHQIS